MRSTHYPGVCAKPGTYYQGWFMYMRYTQGQNEDRVLTIQEYVLNQVLIKQVLLYILKTVTFYVFYMVVVFFLNDWQ